MAVTFTVCGGTGARCLACMDAPSAPELTLSDANAARILHLLGYPAPGAGSLTAPEVTPDQSGIDAVDFALRVLVAQMVDAPQPGYLNERLDQLQDLTEHAISYGCLITCQASTSAGEKRSTT